MYYAHLDVFGRCISVHDVVVRSKDERGSLEVRRVTKINERGDVTLNDSHVTIKCPERLMIVSEDMLQFMK